MSPRYKPTKTEVVRYLKAANATLEPPSDDEMIDAANVGTITKVSITDRCGSDEMRMTVTVDFNGFSDVSATDPTQRTISYEME